jgi:YD repeat-containing protein
VTNLILARARAIARGGFAVLVTVLALLGLAGQGLIARAASQHRRLRSAASSTQVPLGQTFGGGNYGANPTAVDSEVNSLDGALEIDHTDMRVAGIGVPFVLDRQYNSRDVGTAGAFGPGWSSILDLAVRFSDNGRRAIVYADDGQQVGFTYDPAARGWLRDPGVRASLACSGAATRNVPPATCTVTRFSDGVNWTLSHGRVQDYRTAAGQGLRFGYTAGRISSVTVDSTAARALVVHLTRNRAGRVTKLTTPTRSVSYSYDAAGDLSAVTDANRDVWRMTYAAGHRLTGVTAYPSAKSKTGVRVLNAAYNSKTGRVSATVQRLGTQMNDTTFGWSGTGESGHAYRYELVAVNGGALTRVRYTDTYTRGMLTNRQQPLGQAISFQYDGDLDLVKTTNPLGSTDTMTYDSSGDQLSTTVKLDGSGTTEKETLTYDSHHRLTSMTEPVTSYLTDTTTYSYNSVGELTSSTSSGSGTTKYTYNSHALPLTKTDGNGNVTSLSYDAYGNLTGQSVRSPGGGEPNGRGPLSAYNESGQQVLSVPATGNESGGHYVAADATRTVYNPDGAELSVTTPGAATSTTSYDAAGDVTSTTDVNGRKTTHSWSAVAVKGGVDWREASTDPAGTTTDLYDPSGDVLSSTPPQPPKTVSGKPAGVVTDVYNADQQIIRSINGQGVATSYDRDGLGDVLRSTSRGVTGTATYNLVGWATSASTTTISYPPDNGTPGDPTPHTSTTYTQYGLAGQVEKSTDTAGGSISYTFGAGDRIASVTDMRGSTHYSYDNLGDITSVVSPAGRVTNYTYNAQGHDTSQTIGSQTWTMAYNADGNLVQTVDPDGRTANYTYDALNRKTGVSYSWANGTSGLSAPAVNWSYNKLGQRTQMVDGLGTHTYTYDSQGRLTSVDTLTKSGDHQNFSYNYSTPGQLDETYPDGTTVTYHTDDGGNLLGISVPKQSDGSPAFQTGNMLPTTAVTQGSSDAATSDASTSGSSQSAPAGTLYPDGLLGYTFNQPQSNSSGADTLASGTAFYTASMANSANSSNPDPPQAGYIAESDLNGNLLSERWLTVAAPAAGQGNEMTLDYGYNGGGDEMPASEGTNAGVQLTSWSSTYDPSGSNDLQTGSYQYDADGNPTSIQNSGANGVRYWNFTYNDSGEIQSVTTNEDPSNTNQQPVFSYDQAGDMTQAGSVISPILSSDPSNPLSAMQDDNGYQWTFSYNDAGQLASATEDGTSKSVSFSYDGDGNLVSEAEANPGYNTQSMSLIWDPHSATPQLVEADVNNSIHERYFWGNGPLGMEVGGSDYVFHDNQNGTPTMVTNTSGQTVQETYYDPEGNLLDSFSDMPVSVFAQPLIGFDGSYRDPVVGVDFLGGRWYDPNLGMFMSRGAPTPPTPGSSSVASEASSATIGMSASPGTSPVQPVAGTPDAYGVGDEDPTNWTQIGSEVVNSVLNSSFGEFGQGAYSVFETVKPYALGTLASVTALPVVKALWKGWIKLSDLRGPSTAALADAGTEVANDGSVVPSEAADLASDAGDAEDAVDPLTMTVGSDLVDAIHVPEVGILTKLSMAASVAGTIETCGEYGSSSRECIGTALGTAISWTADLACEAVTAGLASTACGVLQSVISSILPLIVEGDGQAFLDSVTFASGFNIADVNVLSGQIVIAAALGPWGAAALLGEVIYANWGAISGAFGPLGDEIYTSFATAGNALANGVEGLADSTISGISTAGLYLSSGIEQLANYLVNDGFNTLANEFEDLGSDINDVADQIGSALCDFASDVSCFLSSAFDFQKPPQPPSGAAGGASPAARFGPAAARPALSARSRETAPIARPQRLRLIPRRRADRLLTAGG